MDARIARWPIKKKKRLNAYRQLLTFTVPCVPLRFLQHSQLATVVHYGGAGKMVTAVHVGIIPFFSDQPFWSHHYTSLGVISPPIPIKSVTADRLAHAIEQATGDKAIPERMRALSKQVRGEKGVAKAVEIIQQVAATR